MDVGKIIAAVERFDFDAVKELTKDLTPEELTSIKDADGFNMLMKVSEATPVIGNSITDENMLNASRIGVYLIDKGIDINAKNNEYTAAFFAASRGHLAIVQKLLAQGCDFNLRSSIFELNPLESSLLCPTRNRANECTSVALFLLEEKAIKDLNDTHNNLGLPALCIAIKEGNTTVTNYMIENAEMLGVDLGKKALDGRTPLDICNAMLEEYPDDTYLLQWSRILSKARTPEEKPQRITNCAVPVASLNRGGHSR